MDTVAMGLMVSIGGAAIAGMSLGSGDREKCNQIFRQTIAVTACISIFLSYILFFCFSPMLAILHADERVITHFREYYQIMLLELPVMVVNSSFGMFIRGEGSPRYYMKVSILSVVLNILLDYLLAGRFHRGAAGIAAASLLSELVCLLCILYYLWKKAHIYHLGKFHFSREACVQAILNGNSEFIGEISTGITMFAYNFVIMRRIGVDGVTAFTIVGYTAYAFNMIIVGFGQGASPLISFCYGAGDGRGDTGGDGGLLVPGIALESVISATVQVNFFQKCFCKPG